MGTLTELQENFGINIKGYKKYSPEIIEKIFKASKKIRNKAIIHINSSPKGGGVDEILKCQIPFEQALGLQSRRLFINAPEKFFKITKKMHNLLQGNENSLTAKEKKLYLKTNKELGVYLSDFVKEFTSGIIIVHDPQPLPLIREIPKRFSHVLRLHIDLSTPDRETLEFLRPMINKYKAVAISSPHYLQALKSVRPSKFRIIMPAIDPLSEKNLPMDERKAKKILRKLGVNTQKPILTQVSRFDPWKDPLGVIRAYHIAKNNIPDLQLVLAGIAFANDDPEAKKIFREVKRFANSDKHIHLFYKPKDLKGVTNETFINALLAASSVVIQNSIREGFGLTITEAMWKEKPIVARRSEGALLQIKHGKNGLMISSTDEAAKAIVKILKNKKLARRLGKNARKSVLKNFLMPRYILDNLKLYEVTLRGKYN